MGPRPPSSSRPWRACSTETHLRAWPVHDHAHAYHTGVRPPAPQDREHNENAPVRGVDAPKLRGLKRRDDAVQEEEKTTEGSQQPASTLPEPELDEIPATDLQQTRDEEEEQGFQDEAWRHELILPFKIRRFRVGPCTSPRIVPRRRQPAKAGRRLTGRRLSCAATSSGSWLQART